MVRSVEEIRAHALVLRAVDYGDADRIVTFFTREHGKLPTFARSARKSQKRFGGALEPFNRLTIRFRDRRGDLASLAAAEIDRARPGIVAEYDLIARASYVTELITEATRDREEHPELFDLLDEGFEMLGSPQYAAAALDRRDAWLVGFDLKLLSLAGYEPRLDACAECGNPDSPRYRFLPERGQVLCWECARDDGGIPLSAPTLRTLHTALTADLATLDRIVFTPPQLTEAKRLLTTFLRYQLGKDLKSTKFLTP